MKLTRRTTIAATLLACLCTTLSAQEPEDVPLRSCRPLMGKGEVPTQMRTLRRASADDLYTGERRQLVVLVDFSDLSFKEAEPLTLWNKIFNEEGYNESSFRGSVHDYFFDQSYGKFNLTFDLYHVSLNEAHQKYRSTSYDDENSQFLVNDIMDILKTEDIEWPVYDWDGDGYVDQLLIVYAGKGQNAGGGSDTIWPHQWWLTKHKDPTTQEYLPPYAIVYNGIVYLIDSYCAIAEVFKDGSYGTFGTICHEYSHCFGFPDFYYGSTRIVDHWDIMDSGNMNGGGFCPAGYSAHERMLMGWLTPVELTGPTQVTGMSPLSSTPEAYLIRNDGHANEYYMVEHRIQTGWDEELPGSGVVIFHIDYDEELWHSLTNLPNSWSKNECHYTIIHASDNSNARNWAYPYAGNDSLTNLSSPAATLRNANADGELFMSKPLYNMASDGNTASFLFMMTLAEMAVDAPTCDLRKGKEELYRMGRLHIVRCEDGTVRKEIR